MGLLCFLLALSLALNSLWLLPHADEPQYEYRAVEVTDENRHDYLRHHPKVKECYIVFSRACGLEHQVRDEPLRLNRSGTNVSQYLEHDYRFVVFTDGFREPTHRTENGSLILSSKSVTEGEVAAELARPYRFLSPTTSRVFDGGNVTMHDELPRNSLVRRDSSIYAIDKISQSRPMLSEFQLSALRVLLWVLVIPVSVAGLFYWYD
ncbi:hypothetical protein SAMN05421858_0389 [Haladaptatus litoreus]|uniref:Uncharacterized protein n=2 Tax=Haladaptatus litoreus TaxID=553468 RepID=A0A1N6VK20_9EURY|nr:hypothetical protein SAMN05421858_0389 [Haladaptatus litoreus]